MNLKVNWMLDVVLRLAVVQAVYEGVVTVQGCWRKWRDADDLFMTVICGTVCNATKTIRKNAVWKLLPNFYAKRKVYF